MNRIHQQQQHLDKVDDIRLSKNETNVVGRSLKYKGRKLRLLLVKGGTWLHGQVESFETTQTAQTTSYIMHVSVKAASCFRKGALVSRRNANDNHVVVVNKTGKNIFSFYKPTTTDNKNGNVARNESMALYQLRSATLALTIRRMNVQGGGIATASPQLGLGDTGLSFEWLEPVDESNYAVDLLRVPRFESNTGNLADIRLELSREWEQESLRTGIINVRTIKHVYMKFLLANEDWLNPLDLLRCVPTVLLPHIMVELLNQERFMAENSAVYMRQIVYELFQDRQWNWDCQDLTLLLRVDGKESSLNKDKAMEATLLLATFNAMHILSEWFLHQNEHAAALLCLQENVDLVQSHRDAITATNLPHHQWLASGVHNLSRGYLAMGHFGAALENLERAFKLCPDSEETVSTAKQLRTVVASWVGTSNALTPFASSVPQEDSLHDIGEEETDFFEICAECDEPDPEYMCFSCGLTKYCSAACQGNHWKTVHRHTCFFICKKSAAGKKAKGGKPIPKESEVNDVVEN